MAKFGKDIMAKEFLLNPQHTFLNQGSYGSAPRRVLEHRIKLINQMEQQADVWFRYDRVPDLEQNLSAACSFLKSDPKNLVFVANATTGINSVVRSLPLQAGDGILLHTFTYFSVRTTGQYMADSKGVQVVVVDFPNPLESSDQLIEAYKTKLDQHPSIKLVVIDYISSMPPVLNPIKELIALCRQYNKMVLIDGAHAPGQLRLNLEEIGADFFVGNLHKWAYTPRGCAVLWVSSAYHDIVFPTVTSFYERNNLQLNFSFQGTQDTTQYHSVKEALAFCQSIGDYEVISDYNKRLIEEGTQLVARKWNTKLFPLPDNMLAPYMRFVELPPLPKYLPHSWKPREGFGAAPDVKDLIKIVWERFRIQSVFVSVYNKNWVRLSVNVYNEIGDFEKLADAILELAKE